MVGFHNHVVQIGNSTLEEAFKEMQQHQVAVGLVKHRLQQPVKTFQKPGSLVGSRFCSCFLLVSPELCHEGEQTGHGHGGATWLTLYCVDNLEKTSRSWSMSRSVSAFLTPVWYKLSITCPALQLRNIDCLQGASGSSFPGRRPGNNAVVEQVMCCRAKPFHWHASNQGSLPHDGDWLKPDMYGHGPWRSMVLVHDPQTLPKIAQALMVLQTGYHRLFLCPCGMA